MTRRMYPEQVMATVGRNVENIVGLKESNTYSEWLLRGELHGAYYPKYAISALYAGDSAPYLL